MKPTRLLMWIVSGVLAVAAVDAAAQPRGRGKRGPGQHRLMERLDLTAEQQKKIKSLRLETAKKAARIQADLKVARLELAGEMGKDTPSTAEVKARVKAVNEARGRMMESRVNMQLAMKKILTPEQQKKMQMLRSQRPGGRRGMRHEGHGRPGHRQGHRDMPEPRPGS